LRAKHCHAYLEDGSGEDVILTSNPADFAALEFIAPTHIVAVSPPPELLRPTHLARNRIFRSVLHRARSGSRLGVWVEHVLKDVARLLRRLSEVMPRRRGFQQTAELSIRSSMMYAKLVEEHASSPIQQLIVFDVFDLPVALTFAEDHQVDVLVR